MKAGDGAVRASWLFGSARELRKSPLETYRKALLAHPKVARFRVGPPRIGFEFDAVFDPDAARQVLATDSAKYRKDAPVFREIIAVLGAGLLTSEGDRWRRDRRIVQPIFVRRKVAQYVGPIGAVADAMVATAAVDAGSGRSIDLNEWAVRYALDALGTAVFGEDLDAVRPTIRRELPLLSEHAVRRGLAIVRVPRSWPTPANRRAARAQEVIQSVVDGLIAKRRSSEPSALESDDGRDDLLSLLLTVRDPDTGEALDDRNIREQTMVFLLGGHETSASAFALTLFLVARHDDVQQKIRDEVARVVGDCPLADADAELIEQLQYTTQVVHEALRLYPPGHTLVRTAAEDAELLGRPVPKGQILAVSMWGIHHNPAVWSDPERFDPDRFATRDAATGSGTHQVRYDFLAFGGGPRGCIGERLAMVELVVGVAAMVRAYRLVALVDEPELDVGLTLRPAGALPCQVEVL